MTIRFVCGILKERVVLPSFPSVSNLPMAPVFADLTPPLIDHRGLTSQVAECACPQTTLGTHQQQQNESGFHFKKPPSLVELSPIAAGREPANIPTG